MITIRDLHKYYGEHHTLKGIDLAMEKGEALALIGPSGSGKSTLLRCLNGLETFESGEIHVNGTELHSINHTKPTRHDRETIRNVRLQVGMVFQQFNLFPHMTALENVIEAPIRVLGTPRDEAVENARALLRRVNLEHRADQFPERLSGGEQQRVAIARALAMKPQAMLFDEPTSSLDPEMVGEVLEVIRDLIEDGMTTLMAAHEMSFAREVADRVIVFDAGDIVEVGPPDQVFTNPQAERTKVFLSRVMRS
ncbi:MAG: amino acid ABC transporter ATP-binding protein [Deltaproteobacteria bacterium]|nr:amino acid ABC transporter ATP-binding protein [Deltaproteobacteria bacterium]